MLPGRSYVCGTSKEPHSAFMFRSARRTITSNGNIFGGPSGSSAFDSTCREKIIHLVPSINTWLYKQYIVLKHVPTPIDQSATWVRTLCQVVRGPSLRRRHGTERAFTEKLGHFPSVLQGSTDGNSTAFVLSFHWRASRSLCLVTTQWRDRRPFTRAMLIKWINKRLL